MWRECKSSLAIVSRFARLRTYTRVHMHPYIKATRVRNSLSSKGPPPLLEPYFGAINSLHPPVRAGVILNPPHVYKLRASAWLAHFFEFCVFIAFS